MTSQPEGVLKKELLHLASETRLRGILARYGLPQEYRQAVKAELESRKE